MPARADRVRFPDLCLVTLDQEPFAPPFPPIQARGEQRPQQGPPGSLPDLSLAASFRGLIRHPSERGLNPRPLHIVIEGPEWPSISSAQNGRRAHGAEEVYQHRVLGPRISVPNLGRKTNPFGAQKMGSKIAPPEKRVLENRALAISRKHGNQGYLSEIDANLKQI